MPFGHTRGVVDPLDELPGPLSSGLVLGAGGVFRMNGVVPVIGVGPRPLPMKLSFGGTPGGVPTADGGVPTTDGGVPTTAGGVPTTDGGVPTTAGGVPITPGGVPVTGAAGVAAGAVCPKEATEGMRKARTMAGAAILRGNIADLLF
jgi:hypothetical protein